MDSRSAELDRRAFAGLGANDLTMIDTDTLFAHDMRDEQEARAYVAR